MQTMEWRFLKLILTLKAIILLRRRTQAMKFYKEMAETEVPKLSDFFLSNKHLIK